MASCVIYLSPTSLIEDNFSSTFDLFTLKLMKMFNITKHVFEENFEKISIMYFNKIWFPIYEESDYKKALLITNCKISLCINFFVLVSTDPSRKYFPAKKFNDLFFQSDSGIDEDFNRKLQNIIDAYAHSSKCDKICIQPFLVDFSFKLYDLTNDNVFKQMCFSILLRKAKGYSSFNMDDVELEIKWAGELSNQATRYIDIWNGKFSSNMLSEKLKENIAIEDFEKKIEVTLTNLNYLRRLLQPDNCYSESVRRLIINILLLPALQSSDKFTFSLNTEYNLLDESNFIKRIGNGPIDYVLLGRTQPLITLLFDKTCENPQTDDLEEIECELNPTILEAKIDIDIKDLPKALSQLIAQMLDALHVIPSRKRTHDGMHPQHVHHSVKGMLSTGHHFMFFSLSEDKDFNLIPTLEYYGKHSINVLLKKSGRSSGLNPNEEVKKSEVESILRSLHYFAMFDYE
ncbi:uncharacterized protein LOC105848844 [Hydra vulgaris]|uniref:uncharacterized protein LOC105848844 n=1 Tax=Hydra vulgaris TaxID=6087 RepID=UPI001F5F043B|nr:uncharacterized protein LOC105848844 [Hydra vulgaris]XP_012564527.2 uncharacterized protein LOC105848844 [Hydra vulgaris]XP_012564528.2 uncharacterized protein LOC105848844 [Hydra vulgaris]XP_047146583.1 uncharacterized protein LOC105848844 [Hydra vulgaris]XP_047146584.1 uncharacterized protein LOC105848844 [Hydra vulgaris]XP_047146585.1 uncharacterized protein LOC105848844 [Hydra vulgaris]